MDTSFYFVRSKGQEKGPYAFYQIQQMRTEDVFTRDKFTPEEWEQLEQFLDDGGDIPRPKTGVPAIRRVDDKTTLRKERRVSVGLTYFTYALAGFTVVAALLEGDHDYIIQSRVMFWLGLFFSVALCHTAVDRLCRRQLQRYPRSSEIDLLVKCLIPFIGFAAIVGGLYALARNTGQSVLDSAQILMTAKKYALVAGVAILYRPFYLKFLATHEYLKPRSKSSVPWMLVLLGYVVLLVLYSAPNSAIAYPAVMSVHDNIFVTETLDGDTDASEWRFPVRLGDTQKAVQRILGNPTVSDRDYVYHSLRISFDQQHRVGRLHFDGHDTANSVFAKKQIVAGITPMSTFGTMKKAFGSKNVTFGDEKTETHVWELPGYRVAACFWIRDTSEGKADTVRWLEISATQ